MVLINLFDGTRNPKFGKALMKSFTEIAKYQEIQVSTKPGGIDIPSYNLIKNSENITYNSNRNQVHLTNLLKSVIKNSNQNIIGKKSFILTEYDLYDNGLNWCFGSVIPDIKGGSHLVMSTYRIKDLKTIAHVATHEFGHMFGAASEGRRNTEENLGSHCTNLCIMQQKLSVPEMTNHANQLSNRKNKFCYDCEQELRNYR